MQSNRKKNLTRVTIDMSPRSHKRLEDLQALVDARSKAHLVTDALRLYEYIAKRYSEGYEFWAVSSEGEREKIALVGPEMTTS